MKHKCFAAVVLAAALWLTGCGGAAAPAAPAGSGAASQSAAAPAVQTAQKERITDQYTLEKDVSGVWEADTGQDISVHVSVRVPQLEFDSPDAASINDELNDIYAAYFREYETYEEAEQPGSEYPQIGVNWDAYWYGDCVSLVMRDRNGGTAPWYSRGWCFDFATGKQVSVAEMLQRMGLDPDTVQQQVQRQAMQTLDREMAQSPYYESWRLDGDFSQMRMDTLECNELENLCRLLPEQNQLVIRSRYGSASERGWQQLDVEIPLTPAAPADTPVLTDTYDGVQVQLEGTQATITLSPAPKTDQWGDIGIRVEQEHSYPILGTYNEYVDVCIGEQEDGFFRPVVYLLTKDGVVEYVDVLRCLLFGDAMAMICQNPIYIANNGVALERSGSEVNLRRADGSVLELAPLSAEWNEQGIPYSIAGAYDYTGENGWSWMDLGSDSIVQLGVQDNSCIYRGNAAYLGVVPEGMVLGISANETEAGQSSIDFVAAFKIDMYNNLTLTMIAGQNPFAEGETQLQMTYSCG